jgi:hypothetical protein
MERGTTVEIWLRGDRKAAFVYAGWAAMISAEGEKPMHVKWRLLDPLPDELWRALAPASAGGR